MKRLLIIFLCFLSLSSVVKADEKRDSLNYYFQLFSQTDQAGDIQNACKNLKQTLRLYKEIREDVSQDTVYATVGNIYADRCYKIGDYETAVIVETEVVNIYKTYGINHINYAKSLGFLAKYYSSLGNHSEAIQLGTEVVGIMKRVLGTDHPYYSTSLNNLAMDYSKNGNYSEAIRLETETMEIRKRVLGADHPGYANTLNTLAGYYAQNGDYNEAIRLETEAMEIRKRVLGTEDEDYATSLATLINYYSKIENYNEAIRLSIDALEIIKKVLGSEHPGYDTFLTNLAGYYSKIGNYDEAIRLGTEALEIMKRVIGTKHPDYAFSLNTLAVSYSSIGNYNKAIQLGTEAMVIRKRILGIEHPDYATSLSNLALYYFNLGNYGEAIRLGTEAMDIEKKVLGAEHLNYAASLSNLALYFSSLGDKNEAIRLETEAMEIRKKVLGPEHPDYAHSLSNLALYFSSLGNFNEAIRLGTEAMGIIKIDLGTEHIGYATSLNNLAGYYSEIGDYDEAIRLETEAIDIMKRVLGAEHPDYALSLGNLGVYYYYCGNYSEAIPLIAAYFSIIQKNVFSTFSGLTASERLFYWNKYRLIFNSSIPNILISSRSPDVASVVYDNSALFAKGLLLSTELEMTKLIQESGDNEALQMYYELHQNRQILNAQYSKPIAERRVNCDSLERVSTNLERQLVSRVKEFGDYTRNLSITWRDVQNKLNDDDIAIEFLSYTEKDSEMHYAALTLCKNDTAPMLTPLFVGSKLLETSRYHETYQTAEADSLVWGPLSSRLEGKAHVYFSASGMLHNIGIEYLPSMDGKDCYRLSSTRELVTHTSNETMRSATLYGDIDYDATYASIESSIPSAIKNSALNETSQNRGSLDYRSLNNGYGPLSETRVELEKVAALIEPLGVSCDTLTGIQASEESFKALSGQHRSLLHISTHGFYCNDEKAQKLKPHLRQMLLGEDRPLYAEDRFLLRCGLCFAGANQTLLGKSKPSDGQGDGILNALEIAQTDLRGLDLVVLSACQTALGDIAQGEGVFGLQRGFKKAGAKSILMSLWNVNDLATELLMVEFYRNYLAGKGKLESLRKAQQYVRDYTDKKGEKLFDDPYYWAGFILLDALD